MGKLGLDIHGVINKKPYMFASLTEIAKSRGHEVHVLTGSKITNDIINELKHYGIHYDNLFSILDHHAKAETDMWQDSNKNWWIDDEIWNKTKGIYCKENSIDLHIDDTKIYGDYFDTPFSHFTIDGHIEIWNKSWKKDFSVEMLNELTHMDEDLEIRILDYFLE